MSASDKLSNALFHFSVDDPNEFMRAPTLHAGTAGSAVARGTYKSGFGNGAIYALSKQNLEIDDLELDDDVANLADAMFLQSRDFPISRSIMDSIGGLHWRSHINPRQRAQAARGYQSLTENRGFTYHNSQEGGLSVVMPSPQFNTHILNSGRPLTPGQALTTSYRELRKSREDMDWHDFETGEVPSPEEDREDFIHKLETKDANTSRLQSVLPRKEFVKPATQQSLPMDWSGVNPSKRSVKKRGY